MAPYRGDDRNKTSSGKTGGSSSSQNSTSNSSATSSGLPEVEAESSSPVPETQDSHLYQNRGELVIGTKPPSLFRDPHVPFTTHIKGTRRKPVSEDQGYGTHELATLVPSDDESEGAPDEELQAVGDAPVCLTGELQVRKEGVQGTVESTQQPAASSSTGPNTPHSPPHSTSPYTTIDKSTSLPALADKPTFSTDNLAPPNSSAEHRLELLDTGQSPGKYDSASSTLEDMWCLESSPSLNRHQGELVIVTTSKAIPSHMYTCILLPTYEFIDKVTVEQEEERYKVKSPIPFYAMAGAEPMVGPELEEDVMVF